MNQEYDNYTSPRRSKIVLSYWDKTSTNLHSGAIRYYHVIPLQYHGGPLKCDDCHLGFHCDVESAQVRHYIGKNALTSLGSAGFERIWYWWKAYSTFHTKESINIENAIWNKFYSFLKPTLNILGMNFQLGKILGITMSHHWEHSSSNVNN